MWFHDPSRCLGLPRVININRHDHRVSRTSLLGVVNSVCGVCRQKVDWTCGGYLVRGALAMSCIRNVLPREGCWNGKELEGVPEETEDIEPYVLQTRLIGSGVVLVLECPMVSGTMMRNWKELDVRCGSISEPFVHPSHPNHPLFDIPNNLSTKCNGCKTYRGYAELSCIEDGCGFALCYGCATLPQVVKHRVHDHPLTLCYGEDASGKYWCDICERVCDPRKWFYTCKDHHASLHTKCVLGPYVGFMPRSILEDLDSYEVVLNGSVSRPFCTKCKLRCVYPIILKRLGVGVSDGYTCSLLCAYKFK
ncbi:unnamed protein product [Microthlaspi erraticum]|uniref:Uncharacterized protein n=1 Tax=Microthlaspi erraticum TaxID=1685480 RepID=A0A6D2JF23_9BRAS|nr:unnamed protein product [Microthlaspi erraticum]